MNATIQCPACAAAVTYQAEDASLPHACHACGKEFVPVPATDLKLPTPAEVGAGHYAFERAMVRIVGWVWALATFILVLLSGVFLDIADAVRRR